MDPVPHAPALSASSHAPDEASVVRLAAAPDAAHRARGWLDVALPEVGGETRQTLRLLVTELVTNAVRHAGLVAGDHVELSVLRLPGTVRVEVADPGGRMTGVVIRPSRQEGGGFGLFLVDQLAERWGYTSDGATRVWFELSLSRHASS